MSHRNIERREGKTIYVGLESSGKSLLMTRESEVNLYRNRRWKRITGLDRPIIGNMAWSDKFLQKADELGVIVKNWQDIEELPTLEECDLYIDEMATYFDSRNFKDLPLDVRLWLAQSSKMGVEIVGAAQDFGQIDVSFRRLCNDVFYSQKIIASRRPKKTAPPVKHIWGLFMMYTLDPRSFDGEQYEMKTTSSIPNIYRLRKSDVLLFNTQERVKLSKPAPLKKIVRTCPEDGKTIVRYI